MQEGQYLQKLVLLLLIKRQVHKCLDSIACGLRAAFGYNVTLLFVSIVCGGGRRVFALGGFRPRGLLSGGFCQGALVRGAYVLHPHGTNELGRPRMNK